jgi:hypothetical protein
VCISRADGDACTPRAAPERGGGVHLAIVTLASVLNAAGLNFTKLDHVCAAARRRGVCARVG